MSAAISDLGIIIHQIRFGEADKFVKILTANHGLIEVVAKGVRRLSSKKSSHLDNLNLIKFQTNRGRVPQYLSQVETQDAFTSIKSDFKKVRTCFYLTEIMNLTLAEGQPDNELFSAFADFLKRLDGTEGTAFRHLAVDFQHYLIGRLGFPPPTDIRPEALVGYFESLIDRPLVSPRLTLPTQSVGLLK